MRESRLQLLTLSSVRQLLLQLPTLVPLQTPREWRFRGLTRYMAGIVALVVFACMIVPTVAEDDFEKNNEFGRVDGQKGNPTNLQHNLIDQNLAENQHKDEQKIVEGQQRQQEKQSHENYKMTAVNDIQEKKYVPAAPLILKNEVNRINNFQQNNMANTIDNNVTNKHDTRVGDFGTDNHINNNFQEQPQILGHDSIVVNKNNNQKDDILVGGVKSGLEDKHHAINMETNNGEIVRNNESPSVFNNGNNIQNQNGDAEVGNVVRNINPTQDVQAITRSISNNNINNIGQVNNINNNNNLDSQNKNNLNNGQNVNQNFGNINNQVNNVQQQQQYQYNAQTQQQQPRQPEIGGININWDWEDFSIMFNSYGGAEMKVRRTPHSTTGEPWPLPQYYSKKDGKIFRVSKDLSFIPVGIKCDILEEALVRHLQRILRGSVEDMYDNLQNAEGSPIKNPSLKYSKEIFMKAPVITRVEVKVRNPCSKYPTLESDESYDVVVKNKKTYIWANEVWGALRGLETFGHLVWKGTDDFLYIKETVISDYPRFPHRGLLVDTSRHYLFKEVILDIIESMEMNKLNVFHWHIVDDQSFPYESKVYPELSRKGAFHPTYVYSLEDIAEIIEFARLRGIRVMPEFDTPGHTYAWGFSRPELLTQCYTGTNPVKGYLGPIDPSKNSTYRFLQTLFQEIVEVFKDEYLHLGGDEVPLACWQSNPEVMAFAHELTKIPLAPQQQNQINGVNSGWSMWSDEIRRVYEYYENRLINIVSEASKKKKKNIKYVMWQEVMNNNLQLPNDTIIQVWMGDMGDVMRATSMGYQVLYSTCWYMDHIEYGTKWVKYYNCDPVDQSMGYHIDEKKVLGGEAAFWSEYFSNENLISLMWPRASAAAERLWSSKDVKNLDKAARRLSEHRCRMLIRGINVGEINGPGYCLHDPPKRRLFNETVGCRGGNCTHTRSLIKENFEVFVSQQGNSLTECGRVILTGNSSLFIMLILTLIVAISIFVLSKTSNRFQRIRICKNRTILITVCVLVFLIYFLCYTTIWMHAFEFSGSYRKTLQEDNISGSKDKNVDNSENVKAINS